MQFIDEDVFASKTGIYVIENTVNNKKYVGQTDERFIRRYWHHKWLLNNNKHHNKKLQNSWNKHGKESFKFYVVHELKEEDSLNDLEIMFIKLFNSIENGYNIQTGGQDEKLNTYISEETRKRVGQINRERMIGAKHSEETKEKMSKSRTGSKNSFSKLTEDDVVIIKTLLRDGESPIKVAKMFNITYGNIKHIRSEKTWKHVQI